ncbi:MAG TPA: D-alanyl-D-alanine carboxypeptidase family protein [Gaiellaceae bacterium]|jgi:D-alanyl-D-alanine carboxypeptidase (penicillin-binding protein 5/6)|nr:D-alanyl-D-alanine carboxypeptidase family protein [Gaiellaceae bacterium]
MRRAPIAVVALVAALATFTLASSAGAQATEPKVAAAAWYLVGEDGSVLAGRDSARPRAIASITKLMTAIVVLEHAKLGDVVRVSPRAAGIGESTVYLRAGEELTVAELLRATLIPSANDAAEALALHVGKGSVDRFVELMNEKATDLGLTDTHFENPHGLDETGHVSSARDTTALVRFALGIPFIREALSRETLSLPGGRTFTTTDDLLASWGPLVAGKTGHTRAAGWSQAAAAQRGDTTVYGAVLGSGSRSSRNDALRALLTYGLDQYRSVQVIDTSRIYATATTAYGRSDVDLVAPRGVASSIRVGRSLVERVVAPTALALPIAKGDRLGRVEVYDGNRLVASSNLVAAESVPDAGLWAKAQWYATETVRNLWGMVT